MPFNAPTTSPAIDRETDLVLFRNAAGMLGSLPEAPPLALRMLEHMATLIRVQQELADSHPEPADLGENVVPFTVR